VIAQVVTPHPAKPIPVGDGAALLARRPDVRAAERRLAADTARIGVATADLYPRITLGGSVGSAWGHGCAGVGSSRWSLGPLISWTFPNIAAARAKIAAAKADSKASLATFDGTVLTALEETERRCPPMPMRRCGPIRWNALRMRRRGPRASAGAAARRADRFPDRAGCAAHQAQADLVAARRDAAFAQVDVFRALAGGWGLRFPAKGRAFSEGNLAAPQGAAPFR
jgi:outer membrane protein TolC